MRCIRCSALLRERDFRYCADCRVSDEARADFEGDPEDEGA